MDSACRNLAMLRFEASSHALTSAFNSYQRVIRTISGECSGVMAVLNEASNLFTQLKVCLDPVRLLRLAHLAV